MEVDTQKLIFRLCQFFAILAHALLITYTMSFKTKTPTVAAFSTANETDSLALLGLKNSIVEDPLNIMSSWNDSIHFCHWAGVSCSKRHSGRVTLLNLEGGKLAGWLPPHIGNLSFLRILSLSVNNFRGEIPQEIGRLKRLRILLLDTNAFEGKIPNNLSSCSNLQAINLSYNHLVGEIPAELSYLFTKQLIKFAVLSNSLSGSIPLWLGNASSLTLLSLAQNKFHGSIPIELGKLSKLQILHIFENNLSGTVPPPIYNLSSLVYLDLGSNQLEGIIPQDIGFSLPNLQGLYFGINRFAGPIPVSLSNASGLVYIGFSWNNFIGTVPLNLGSLRGLEMLSISENQLETVEPEGFSFLTSLMNCSKLRFLDISSNRFKGELPASISNFSTTLEQLFLETNQIFGIIPEGVEGLVGLTRLMLSSNSLTGEIPAGIGKLKRLKDLRLFRNRISGTIPSSLGNISQLLRLYLHENDLGGSIPPSLGNCQNLNLLDLSANNLTGVIPKEVVSLSSMISFTLAQNSLTGSLLPEVGNMIQLTDLDISQNKLSGEIPSTISTCVMLEYLLMDNNLFEGRIPSAFNRLKSLHVLDLSRNNISGQIPVFLQNFTFLQNLNLSFNNLQGKVPSEGVFTNASSFSIIGNMNLCGGINSLGLPACKFQVPNKRCMSRALKIAILVAITCSILLACLILILWRLKKAGRNPSTISPMDEQFQKASYAELSRATNEFSSFNLIGKGSFGSVYKGILGSNRIIVAVKVLNLKQRGAAKSYMAECNALRNIRHRNLIKVITTCSSIDFKGDDFKALVFEFMPNGSLEELLHRSKNEKLNQGNLSLEQRLSISIDVASALEYLHHHCQTPIVHGDLKPSNVLLDNDMTAHVGDFGLARFLSNIQPDHSSQNQTSSSSVIKGTVGYVAPEYGMGGKASMQGDVYAFGILLLELFTGRRPTDGIFNDGLDIHRFVKMALPERIMEIVEPSMLLEAGGNDEYVEKVEECLAAMLRIGVSCSMESPRERIDIRDVVAAMYRIKDKLILRLGARNPCIGFEIETNLEQNLN